MLKFAKILVGVMSAECLAASAAFAYSHNWKQATYWFLVACINAVATTF